MKIHTTPTVSPQRAPVTPRVAEEVAHSKTGSPVWQLAATPPPADSSLALLKDFPPLSTRPSRAEQRRMRDGREESSLVFRDAHHAQLREVHGANIRALEALETVDRCKTRPSQEEVNSLAEDTIRDLATEGEHVTVEKV